MLVLDGNQKNNRPVCAAEDAGYVEYEGLPGSVKTGCMDTPEQKSRFCTSHRPREMKSESCPESNLPRHRVIEMIVTTFYEVYNIYVCNTEWWRDVDEGEMEQTLFHLFLVKGWG